MKIDQAFSNGHATNMEFNENNMIRILLVEDEPANAAILSSYLQMAGYQVDEATDGVEAMVLLEKAPEAYHLVVTDKRMPNMNGLELAARLKADRRFSNIPVILQTGDTAHDEFIKGIKAGVYYYLSKPYEESTLLTIVRAAVVERERKEIFERRIASQQNALVTLMKGEFFSRRPMKRRIWHSFWEVFSRALNLRFLVFMNSCSMQSSMVILKLAMLKKAIF